MGRAEKHKYKKFIYKAAIATKKFSLNDHKSVNKFSNVCYT